MSNRIYLTLLPLAALAASIPFAVKAQDASEALLAALRGGGYVIYFRHAQTESDYADQVSADPLDCAPQRVLSRTGWDQARTIGAAIEAKQSLLFEGAQGGMLDVDHGTYPFVTSSNTVAGGALTGVGLGPKVIDRVLGITKAYTTRVGSGPFPTELLDADGELLRKKGDEFGATTGRPRRCGWFDAVVVRHAVRTSGIDGLVLTKLDVLDLMPTIKIAVSYSADGITRLHPPADADCLAKAQPIFEEMPGWNVSTKGATRWEDLPIEAQRYIRRIETLVGAPVAILSTGPGREETMILRPDVLAAQD